MKAIRAIRFERTRQMDNDKLKGCKHNHITSRIVSYRPLVVNSSGSMLNDWRYEYERMHSLSP